MSKEFKSILIISYYAYPSAAVGAKRVSELTRVLEEQGHKTTTISAKGPDLRDDLELLNTMPSTRSIRLGSPRKLYPFFKKLIGGRLDRRDNEQQTSHLRKPTPTNRSDDLRTTIRRWLLSLEGVGSSRKLWGLKVISRLLFLRISNRFDLILASGPPQIAYFCGALASGLHNKPLVLDFRDPWLSSRDQDPATSSVLSRGIDDWLMSHTFSKISHSVFTSQGASDAMSSEHPKIASATDVVYNGFDEMAVENTSQLGQGSLTLLFAGTLYLNRDPFPFFTAIKRLLDSQEIDSKAFQFKLLGHCERAMGVDIQPWLDVHGLTETVRLTPAVPPSEAKKQLESADVLVNFAQGQPNQIPAKLFEYIGSKKFIVQISERASDSAKVLIESGAGRVIEPDDEVTMHDTLHLLYEHYVNGKRSNVINTKPCIGRYSRKIQNDFYVKLLIDVINNANKNEVYKR